MSTSSSINHSTVNRSSLSRESILEARQRRRRRIQTQKQLQVHHLQHEVQQCTGATIGNPIKHSSTFLTIPKSTVQTRFSNTTVISTMNSIDTVLPVDDGHSFALVSDDDEKEDGNDKSTQSMIEKEIDSFILPIDDVIFSIHRHDSSRDRNGCAWQYDNGDDGDNNDEYNDPYLVPISSIRKKLAKHHDRLETIEHNDRNKTEAAFENEPHMRNEVLPVPPKSGTLLNKASKIMLDRRPVSYVCIPTPVFAHRHDSCTTIISTDEKDGSNRSHNSVNDMDSIMTIHQLLDGIDILPPGPPQDTSTAVSISEQFQQEQQALLQTYDGQPPAFLLLLSHMYGNAYLHQYHDIEHAKLWYEYANDQSNHPQTQKQPPSKEPHVVVDSLDRCDDDPQRRQCHLNTNGTMESRGRTRRKIPDNRLQQSLHRIRRLQRWYYEENPDVDENLLFEL